MRISYPVKVDPCPPNADSLSGWAIIDSRGCWACVAPSGALAFADRQQAKWVAEAINHAYYMGKLEAQEAIRLALGIEEE